MYCQVKLFRTVESDNGRVNAGHYPNCCGVWEQVNAGHDIHCWNPDDICRVSLAMEPEGKIQKLKKNCEKKQDILLLKAME